METHTVLGEATSSGVVFLKGDNSRARTMSVWTGVDIRTASPAMRFR